MYKIKISVIFIFLLFSFCDSHSKNSSQEKRELVLLGIGYVYYENFIAPFIPGPVIDYSSLDSQKRGRLISSQDLIRANRDQLAYGISSSISSPNYNFKVYFGSTLYEITYETIDLKGNIITASGAIWVPRSSDALPIISYNHGTELSYNTGWRMTGALFSASGYITLIPDYIGYGKTKNMQHPYIHASSLASATIDFIRAAKKFCEYNKINLNQKDFLNWLF